MDEADERDLVKFAKLFKNHVYQSGGLTYLNIHGDPEDPMVATHRLCEEEADNGVLNYFTTYEKRAGMQREHLSKMHRQQQQQSLNQPKESKFGENLLNFLIPISS
jgi:hypothetical protein